MKIRLKLFGFLIATFAVNVGIAQSLTNNQLNIGVGAGAYAMGNAVVATIDNTTAGYWNPAGLANIKADIQPAVMHAELFASISKFDYLSGAFRLNNKQNVLGFSLMRNAVDGIPNTLFAVDGSGIFYPERVTFFSSADWGFLASFAKNGIFNRENLNAGVNAKLYYRKAGTFTSAFGFGLDAGLQYKSNNLSAGLMLKDITTTVLAWNFNFTEEEKQVLVSTGNVIPVKSTEIVYPSIILGVAYEIPFNEKLSLTAELDATITTDGKRNVLISAPASIDPNLGLELNINEVIFIRGGLNNYQKGSNISGKSTTLIQPNLGLGLKVQDLHIDYALTRFGQFGEQGVFSHIFSLMFDIKLNNERNY